MLKVWRCPVLSGIPNHDCDAEAPDIKVDAVRGFGGNVVLHGSNFDEAKAEAERLSAEHGYTFVPHFRSPAGDRRTEAPLGMEMLQQNGHMDYIFCACRWWWFGCGCCRAS